MVIMEELQVEFVNEKMVMRLTDNFLVISAVNLEENVNKEEKRKKMGKKYSEK